MNESTKELLSERYTTAAGAQAQLKLLGEQLAKVNGEVFRIPLLKAMEAMNKLAQAAKGDVDQIWEEDRGKSELHKWLDVT